jgi:hypothetical protein
MKTDVTKNEVARLIRQRPFRPFAITLDSGERVLIEHPENIAFDPINNGARRAANDFYVTSGSLRLFSTFDAVSSIATLDTDGSTNDN